MSNSRDIADSAATINFIDGLTSNAQTQINTVENSVSNVLPSQTGNADKYLTTDGTDAAWGTLSPAGSITATASGAITAGQTVIVNADGTVSGVTSTFRTDLDQYSPFQAAVYPISVAAQSDSGLNRQATFDKKNNRFIYGYYSSYTTYPNRSGYQLLSYDFGDSDILSLSPIGDMIYLKTAAWNLDATAYDHDRGIYLGLGPANNTGQVMSVVTILGTNGVAAQTDQTLETERFRGYNQAYAVYAAVYVSKYQKFFWLYKNSGPNLTLEAITFNDRQPIFSATTTVASSGSYNDDPTYGIVDIIYSEERDNFVVFWNNSGTLQCKVYTFNGSSFTASSLQTVASGTSNRQVEVKYMSSQNVYIFAYVASTGQSAFKAATLSGTTFTFGSETIPTTSATNANEGGGFAILDNASKFIQSVAHRYQICSVSGTTITGDGVFDIGVTDSGGRMSIGCKFGAMHGFDENGYVASYGNVISTQKGGYSMKVYNTNINADNFIGISSGNYTNGQTAAITIKSGVNTSLTGLTAGKKYYADIHGNLTQVKTTNLVGSALSSTSILVK